MVTFTIGRWTSIATECISTGRTSPLQRIVFIQTVALRLVSPLPTLIALGSPLRLRALRFLISHTPFHPRTTERPLRPRTLVITLALPAHLNAFLRGAGSTRSRWCLLWVFSALSDIGVGGVIR